MKRNLTRAALILSILSVAHLILGAMLDFLGAADVVCTAIGGSLDDCGSRSIIMSATSFLAQPPAWYLALCVAIALAAFAWAERQREKLDRDKLQSLFDEFWSQSAARADFEDRCLEEFAQVREQIEAIAQIHDSFKAETEDALATKANSKRVNLIRQDYMLEIRNAVKQATDSIGFLRDDFDAWRDDDYQRFQEKLMQTPPKKLNDWIGGQY